MSSYSIPDTVHKSGLHYEELSVGDMCWFIDESGVIRAHVTEKHGSGSHVTYTICSSIGESDTQIEETDVPTGVVFGIGLDGDMSPDARKKKHNKLTKYWQSIFLA